MDKYREQILRFQELVDTVHEYVVYDTETTGLNPLDCDIIEISAIKVRDDGFDATIIDELDIFVNIGYPLSKLVSSSRIVVSD